MLIVQDRESNNEEYTFELQRKTGKNQSLKKGNQMLNSNDRMHYVVKGDITRYLRNLAFETITDSSPTFSIEAPKYTPENPCIVLVTVYTPTKRRIYPPNVYPTVKALIDGMTDAGLWSDDNSTVIQYTAFTHGGMSNTSNYKIKLTINGIEG